VEKPYSDVVSQAPGEGGPGPDLIAIGLLRLQQRFDALERLYNEEIDALTRELTQLKADYVRNFQIRSPLPRKQRAARGQTTRTHKS
jgi:hypothetical protein